MAIGGPGAFFIGTRQNERVPDLCPILDAGFITLDHGQNLPVTIAILLDGYLLPHWKCGDNCGVSAARTIARKLPVKTIETIINRGGVAGLGYETDVHVLDVVRTI